MRLPNGSRMTGDCHVRFCEKLVGKFHRLTHHQYHWQLDVHLSDDADKKYDDIAAENFARTKRLLLNLVQAKHPEGKKRSVRSRLKRIAWDMDYLLSLLAL